jgi:hypothetical protein
MLDATPMHKPTSFKDLKHYDVFVFEEYYPDHISEYIAIATPESNKDYLYFKVFGDDCYIETKSIPLREDFLVGGLFKYYLHTSYADNPILDTMDKFPEEFI